MMQQLPGEPPVQPEGFFPHTESIWSRNDRNTFLDTPQESRLPTIPPVQRRNEPALAPVSLLPLTMPFSD